MEACRPFDRGADAPRSWGLTDPAMMFHLERHRRPGRNCLMLVSLTKPWSGYANNQPAMCYKIAATVIDLDQHVAPPEL